MNATLQPILQRLNSPLTLFLLTAAVLFLAAGLTFQSLFESQRVAAEAQLRSIGEARKYQVEAWLEERRSDAGYVGRGSSMAREFERWLSSGGQDERAQAALLKQFDYLHASYGYDGVSLFDLAGRYRFGGGPLHDHHAHEAEALAALRNQEPVLVDLHSHPDQPTKICMGMMTPLIHEEPVNGIATRKTVGVAFLAMDAERALFPYFHQWPMPSRTGELVLARPEGNQVQFLITHKAAPMSVKEPLIKPDLPAARALRGELGILEGARDYVGEPVLAYASAIKYTPWILIAKQDQTEVDAPIRSLAIRVLSVTLGLLSIIALGYWLWWRSETSRYKARLLAKELELAMQAKAQMAHYHETLEAEVAVRTAQLKTANQDLENFSYSVSHDLRAPLRAIDGFVGILLEDYAPKLDAEGLRLFGVVQDNARKMGQLIDDILAFSRAGRLELEQVEVDMNRLVEEVWRNLSQTGDEPIEFTCADLPPVQADPRALRQVWQNLLGNARKFSRNRRPARIEVSSAQEAGRITYTVSDNGAGFNPEYANKLFGLFQRLHGMEEFEGTGVGLAIVKRFVEKHGGSVSATGAVQGGARFSFSLPATP